jgi:hypothetical protein
MKNVIENKDVYGVEVPWHGEERGGDVRGGNVIENKYM